MGYFLSYRDFVTQQRQVAHFIVEVPYRFSDTIARFDLKPLEASPWPIHEIVFEWVMDCGARIILEKTPAACFFMVVHCSLAYLRFHIPQKTLDTLCLLDWKSQ